MKYFEKNLEIFNITKSLRDMYVIMTFMGLFLSFPFKKRLKK
jgi:hypothetical protein